MLGVASGHYACPDRGQAGVVRPGHGHAFSPSTAATRWLFGGAETKPPQTPAVYPGPAPLLPLAPAPLIGRELDNFEHVLAAAPQVAQLLEACPAVKVLVTSRAALRIRWEHLFVVPPLAVPGPSSEVVPAGATAAAAVVLFIHRGQAVAPELALDRRTTAAVAAICRRLAGLPLALELAAVRRAPIENPFNILYDFRP